MVFLSIYLVFNFSPKCFSFSSRGSFIFYSTCLYILHLKNAILSGTLKMLLYNSVCWFAQLVFVYCPWCWQFCQTHLLVLVIYTWIALGLLCTPSCGLWTVAVFPFPRPCLFILSALRLQSRPPLQCWIWEIIGVLFLLSKGGSAMFHC